MKVYGVKKIVIRKEQNLGNGKFQAGLSQNVIFVMELITQKNVGFWYAYANDMKICAKSVPHGKEVDTAIKGFTNALELVGTKSSVVYVVYSTLDIGTVEQDNIAKMINIQMCMTVTTSATIQNFPAVTHMGIFRSPLLSADLRQGGALGQAGLALAKTPDFYKDKGAKGISLVLHCFAARGMVMFLQGRQLKLMITAPLEHMGGVLAQVGKIIAVDKSSKVLSTPTFGKGSSLSSSAVHTTPMMPSMVKKSPPLTMVKGMSPSMGASNSSLKKTVPSFSNNNNNNNNNNSSSSSSYNNNNKIILERPIGQLEFTLNNSPMSRSLQIRYKDDDWTWTQLQCGWLFELAFNLSHKYAATFTDFRVLHELHQDLQMGSGPHRATLVTPKN